MLNNMMEAAAQMGLMVGTLFVISMLICAAVPLVKRFPKIKEALVLLALAYLVFGTLYFGISGIYNSIKNPPSDDYERYYDYEDNDMPWRR